ncbi:MAG: aminoacetone oxidase family FAD-binding enzyme [Phycisphaeraceae bacterium]|nr:aminoacetone oxidase family FAD-binding enzyme [Phycisphaeraceae bacterium]
MNATADIAVVGAGAAGLMAAIQAGRACRELGHSVDIAVLDGAKKPGAKILVAGGGRCNVTHHAVDETAYAGSSRHAIKKVLRAFDVSDTVDFFRELGVELKREPTGKLFPTTDDARTVLDALLGACRSAGVRLVHPWRVESVERSAGGFILRRDGASETLGEDPHAVTARLVILATGGMALPRSGSDGHGYALARSLGHATTERIFPALVPLVLDAASPLRALSGVACTARLELRSATGKRLVSFTNAVLCTHFGLSGPAVLDISRYWSDARASARSGELPRLVVSWLPEMTPDALDTELAGLGAVSPGRWLAARLPERLARTICTIAGVEASAPGHQLTRDARKRLVGNLLNMPLPVVGDRGFTHAEVTGGGIPLTEVHLDTMASRMCPGLLLCGEILDVDGRIGGFNFQWAWASGFVAGRGAARMLGAGPA